LRGKLLPTGGIGRWIMKILDLKNGEKLGTGKEKAVVVAAGRSEKEIPMCSADSASLQGRN